MINSVKQLNDWAVKAGVKHQNQLLPRLIEKREIITPQIAKLIMQKLAA